MSTTGEQNVVLHSQIVTYAVEDRRGVQHHAYVATAPTATSDQAKNYARDVENSPGADAANDTYQQNISNAMTSAVHVATKRRKRKNYRLITNHSHSKLGCL